MTAYNISNSTSVITIRQLGEILAKIANVKLITELPSEIEEKGFNPMRNSSLDSTALETLGWEGIFDAERGLTCTVRVIREKEGS